MLLGAKAPSLLEAKMDDVMVNGLYEITKRPDLTTDKIQHLFKNWEDPEPIFVYLASLYSNTSSIYESSQYKQSLDLTAEMMAHMDPPDFSEWKEWRYYREDELTKRQLEDLKPEQVAAYSEDDYVDLGEVLVGLLPTDKPVRIQDELMRGFKHDWSQLEPDTTPFKPKFAKRLSGEMMSGSVLSFGDLAKEDLSIIESDISKIDYLITLQSDSQILERLPAQLANWQKAELDKRESLMKMGLRGDETREEIEA